MQGRELRRVSLSAHANQSLQEKSLVKLTETQDHPVHLASDQNQNTAQPTAPSTPNTDDDPAHRPTVARDRGTGPVPGRITPTRASLRFSAVSVGVRKRMGIGII